MSRARGANVIVNLGMNASSYGNIPSSGFYTVPIAGEIALGEEQNLIPSDLLGLGREPQVADRDAVNNRGRAMVTADARNLGWWLRLLYGPPTTTPGLPAEGSFTLPAQPTADTTIVVNGVTFTFKASGATGAQVNLGSTLADTMENLATVLNASVDTAVDDATYRLNAKRDTLLIRAVALGTGGNAFTLANGTSNAVRSAATLTGGSASGAYNHRFSSGASSLPDAAIEICHPEVPACFMNFGVMADTAEVTGQRGGLLNFNIGLIAQGENDATGSSGAGSPTELVVKRFSQFSGKVIRPSTGLPPGDIESFRFQYSNGLDVVDLIREDGRISGADPGAVSAGIELQTRFKGTSMDALSRAGTPINLRMAWENSVAERLQMDILQAYLPRPQRVIQGPGAVKATYRLLAAEHPSLGRSVDITLVNDVSSYA